MSELRYTLDATASAEQVAYVEHSLRTSFAIGAVRREAGTWPRPFQSITMRHIVKGEGLDPVAVARAVELSDEKYCTVVSTLRSQPVIQSHWTIESA